jgi:hypothetical protein
MPVNLLITPPPRAPFWPYRLPTDHEWSCTAGIGRQGKAEKTPESKEGEIENVYPLGVIERKTTASAMFK